MKHSYIDKYCNLKSPIHLLNPVLKTTFALVFVIFITTIPLQRYQEYFFYFLILIILVFLSKFPILYILKKSLLILPFVFLVAIFLPFYLNDENYWIIKIGIYNLKISKMGMIKFLNLIIKSWLAIITMILLSSTTRFRDLLYAFYTLKLPSILILLLSFMYRYIFIIYDEAQKMYYAAILRSGKKLNIIQSIKIISKIIGVLFIRSYERSERVYYAMIARGFNGNIVFLKKPKLLIYEVNFFLVMLIILFILRFSKI